MSTSIVSAFAALDKREREDSSDRGSKRCRMVEFNHNECEGKNI